MREHFYTKDTLVNTKYKCNIGDYTYSIGKPEVLYWGEDDSVSLTIGKYCSIAIGLTIFLGGDHRNDWITTYPFTGITDDWPEGKTISPHNPLKKEDVYIGNDVWFGRNVTVMSGITIGDGASIAANAVVTNNVEPYAIVGGNPARFIKKRFSADDIEKLLDIAWWNWEESKVRENIHLLCSSKIEEFIDLYS